MPLSTRRATTSFVDQHVDSAAYVDEPDLRRHVEVE